MRETNVTASPSALAKALAEVQANLPSIDKTRTAKVPTKNGGEYSYKYADLAQVSSKVLPLLSKVGLTWMTFPTLDEGGHFVLRYELLHESGESRGGTYPLPDPSSRPQELGSAVTYGRRYCLCSVVGVVPDDDDDGQAAQQSKPQTRRNTKQPASSTTEDAKWVYRVTEALLTVSTPEKADKGKATVDGSALNTTDVSGLLSGDDRETLGVDEGGRLSLAELAAVVVTYVGLHGRAVRAPVDEVAA